MRRNRISASEKYFGWNQKGQTKWDKRVSAKICGFCENLRFPAVLCENLRLRNAVIPMAKICKNLRKTKKTAYLVPFLPFSLSLLFPPLFPTKMRRKNPATKSGGPKLKTRNNLLCHATTGTSICFSNASVLRREGTARGGTVFRSLRTTPISGITLLE